MCICKKKINMFVIINTYVVSQNKEYLNIMFKNGQIKMELE